MKDDISDIRDFYNRNVEKEDGRLTRHPVERDVTWRYLDAYLPESGRILELGAATGAYTIPLAEKGYRVTAVELASKLSGECRRKVADKGLEDRVTCIVGDGRDLSLISETSFDAALVMGPLYHLVEEEDRKLQLKQVFDRLKPGGRIFSAFISRYGFWSDILMALPYLIEFQKDIRSVLETGRDIALPSWDSQFRAYFATVPEIPRLHEDRGFITQVLAGLEPTGEATDKAYSELPENQRELWLDLLFEISSEPSIVGASSHLLYIGEKPA